MPLRKLLFGFAYPRHLAVFTAMVMWAMGLANAAYAQNGSVAQGKVIFESRCIACHSLDTHRVGPALGTVYGRAAGKAPDFSYSKALAAAQHRWTRDKLLAWLSNPEALVPGQGMGYQVPSAPDREDLVAYLASLATAPH